MQLGDTIHDALARIGVTPDRVERWLGHPCRCPERQERLNQIGRWAARVLGGRTDKAEHHLEEIMR